MAVIILLVVRNYQIKNDHKTTTASFVETTREV